MTKRLSVLLLASSLAACATDTGPKEPVVDTASGTIAGTTTGDVTAYLGIPFAAPPVGENRWREPQPVLAWEGVRPATSYGASCMQPSAPPDEGGPYTPEFTDTPPPSEDCLFLNVWTPSAAGEKRPVIVWIHGGGFNGGSAAVPVYDGAELAKNDVVVVSMNYRLGPFGFMAHPALSEESDHNSSGNYGLMDQLSALRWVQENISLFGGDPANVTIAGQSAGAASVNDLVVSPLSEGLFQRAIAQSGSGLGIDGPSLESAERDGVAFANFLEAHTADELRALTAEQVVGGLALPWLPSPSNKPRIMFRPIVDGYVLHQDPANPTVRPTAMVPLMTGYNSDEAPAGADTKTPAGFEQSVRARFADHADAILALYPHATDAEASESATLLARDRYLASLLLWTDQRTQSSGQPIYRYLFTQPLPVASGPSFGSFHTAEVPYLFGNLDTALRPYTETDQAVSKSVQNYWINFARTGDPNGEGLPTWDRVTGSDSEVLVLDMSPEMGMAVSSNERFEAIKQFVEDGGRLSLF